MIASRSHTSVIVAPEGTYLKMILRNLIESFVNISRVGESWFFVEISLKVGLETL